MIGKRRALIAEDDPISQDVLRRRMRQLGYDSDVVADGQAAINALLHRAYDVILMDCQMPTVDGKEATLAIRLREIDGQHQRTPIIAVTAHGDQFSEASCRAAGMDAFLGKPVHVESLRAALDEVLQTSHARPDGGAHAAQQSLRAPRVRLSGTGEA